MNTRRGELNLTLVVTQDDRLPARTEEEPDNERREEHDDRDFVDRREKIVRLWALSRVHLRRWVHHLLLIHHFVVRWRWWWRSTLVNVLDVLDRRRSILQTLLLFGWRVISHCGVVIDWLADISLHLALQFVFSIRKFQHSLSLSE